MQRTIFGTLLLFMSFLSLAASEKKEGGAETAIETMSSVIIDHSKKIVSESETIPAYYTESVRNISSVKPAFVSIDIYRLNNIGGEKEDLTKVDLSDEADIYVIPNQVVVPASGVRSVRIYLTEKLQRDQDQYFRIRFSPSTSPVQDETEKDKKKVPVSSLFIGMGAGQLLMVSRNNPAFDTKVSIDKNAKGKYELVINNMGNSFVRLDNMKTCFQKEYKKPCRYVSGSHVNAGSIKKLSIDDEVQTIFVELVEGDKIRKVEYDRQAAEPLKVS